jgi:hypothetical protein
MISGEYLPTLPSFSIAFRASVKETFLKRKSSTTIFGVIIKGIFRNLEARIAFPSSVASTELGKVRAALSASASPRCKDNGILGFLAEGSADLISPLETRSRTTAASGYFFESSFDAVSETTDGGTKTSKVAHAISNKPHLARRITALLSRTRLFIAKIGRRKRFGTIVNECRFSVNKEEPEIEIIVDGEIAFFSWNNETIQDLSEELGEPEFPEARPCG